MPDSSVYCIHCEQSMPAGMPAGLCPLCLLKAATKPMTAADATLESPRAGFDAATRELRMPGHADEPVQFIGRYRLLQEIGEGGFGIVYLAQQTEPVKRRVALKIIKPGMDSREVVARFEAERQALALMDHPNIAQVFDGGATETGRPYFVMELVRGVPITQYCDEARLNMRRRLELFLDVLSAVQQAHQKGVIHRDLKPSNILVSPHDGRPVVKVIDFGIAKALNVELTEKILFTGHGLLIGTPEYMSPEQAEINALDVDTRSDVYSLGVVLYELMTGKTPLDPKRVRQAGYDEIQRMIREEEPPSPSTRLSTLGQLLPTVAWQRGTHPQKLARQMSGELDWIVMKALEKERERRYDTASAFAEDIRRHLADEAVSASPPSPIYRLRKFVRRNKGVIVAVFIIGITMIAGTAASVWQARLARQARDVARQAEAFARDENSKRKRQLQEAARTDRLTAMELLCQHRYRDAFALLARACEYDPDSTLAAETAVFQLNVVGLAQEVHVLVGEGEFPLDPLNRNGWLKRVENKEWLGVDDAVFLQDGRRVLTLQLWPSIDDSVSKVDREVVLPQAHLWDAQSGKMVEALQRVVGKITAAGRDSLISVDTPAGAIRLNWPWEQDSSDVELVLSRDRTREVRIQGGDATLKSRHTGGRWQALTGHQGNVLSSRFSTDGQKLVTCGVDQTALLRDAESGAVELVFAGHAGGVTNARFSGDGSRLLTCSEDTTARIWELADTRLVTRTTDVGEDRLISVAFATDGALLGRTFGRQRFCWDSVTGTLLRTARETMDYGKGIDDFRGSNGHFEMGLHQDKGKSLILVDDRSNQHQVVFEGHADEIMHARLSYDARWVATASRDRTIRLWDARNGQCLFASKPEFETASSPACLLFGPDSRNLLVTSKGKNCLLEIPTGKELLGFESDENTEFTSAGFSPDGRLMAVGDSGAHVTVWDVSNGHVLATLGDHPQTVSSVAFSPNGTLLATACWRESLIQVWDTAAWQHVCRIHKPGNIMERVVFSPDSRLIAAESDRQDALNIWVAETGEALAHLPLQAADFRSITFSPDGYQIATAARQGGAFIWVVPGFEGVVPSWFPDFIRVLVQKRVGSGGQLINMMPEEVRSLRQKVVEAAESDSSRYGEIARWFLMPADQRPIRPGAAKSRKEVADLMIVAEAGPVQLRQALGHAPTNPFARQALAKFVSDEREAECLRQWAREHMPSPVSLEIQDRMRRLDGVK